MTAPVAYRFRTSPDGSWLFSDHKPSGVHSVEPLYSEGDFLEMQERAEKAEAESRQLRTLFDDYGDHREGCDEAQPDCSCGMRQACRVAMRSEAVKATINPPPACEGTGNEG